MGAVTRLPGGEILVLDNGSAELRVFSADGAFLRAFGGRGQGPGELVPPAWVATGVETFAVMDQTGRATFFQADGTVVRIFVTRGAEGSFDLLGGTRAGWMAQTHGIRFPADVGVGEVFQDSASVHVVDLEAGDLGRKVVRYGGQRYVRDPEMTSPPMFGGRPAVGLDATGRMFVTAESTYRIDVYEPDGTRVGALSPDHEPRPVTKRDLESYAAAVRAFFQDTSYPDAEGQMRRLIDERLARPRSDVIPATGDLLVAADGALWVERTDLMEDPGGWEFRRTFGRGRTEGQAEPPTVWDRFDRDGERLRSVLMPPRFHPYDLEGEGAVLGVLRDELGVEYVARLRVP